MFVSTQAYKAAKIQEWLCSRENWKLRFDCQEFALERLDRTAIRDMDVLGLTFGLPSERLMAVYTNHNDEHR